jgi:cell wall-associated NlpC family hydrolase
MHRIYFAACLAMLTAVTFAQTARPKLGNLGQATVPTRIYASPNSHSRIFSKVPAQRYLVIKPAPTAEWYAVLLQNGVYGFVPSKAVKELPYEVRPRTYSTRDEYTMNQGDVASRSGMANYALNFVGTPYKWGGNDEQAGIDCSGFVKKMYGKIGLELPRTAAQQALVG